ncbi:hypothetical protein QCN29_17665 [Streptomyces sp. HNM0663]|uniref:N-acetyltransferase domain-containing protein n=1 Tax=Streptomyces chengmaiensis TaxID=3040919 RepID=A0ABT6HQH7_9ACTN|nr:hypothetical protein [Streptomyces chengmaiensis]MDH2390586.1 hypothetical protein [Streptomyces chengmaiensis]
MPDQSLPRWQYSHDIEAIVETLSEAFFHDPVMEWIFPQEISHRRRALDSFYTISIEHFLRHGGHAWATPEHEAVLVWTPPGEPNLSEADTEAYNRRLEHALGGEYKRVEAFLKALEQQAPQELPDGYVHVMFAARHPGKSTSADWQTLMHALREMVFRESLDIYAESSSLQNLRIWKRLGFQRIGQEIRLPDGGPDIYPIFGNVNGRIK